MKLVIPEISWHNRDPVLSVHFQPTIEDGFYRLATGGSDSHVFVMFLILDYCSYTCMSISVTNYHFILSVLVLDMAN